MLPKFLLSLPADQDTDYLIHTEYPSFLAQVDRDTENQPLISVKSIIRWYDDAPTDLTTLDEVFEEAFLNEEYDVIEDDEDWDD
ncbi:MAG: hypothetical protein QM669_14345 [Siphonobacter sp.]